MTLRHMKIFLAVYQTQHITKAAQQLRMTQPAVTRAIQDMLRRSNEYVPHAGGPSLSISPNITVWTSP